MYVKQKTWIKAKGRKEGKCYKMHSLQNSVHANFGVKKNFRITSTCLPTKNRVSNCFFIKFFFACGYKRFYELNDLQAINRENYKWSNKNQNEFAYKLNEVIRKLCELSQRCLIIDNYFSLFGKTCRTKTNIRETFCFYLSKEKKTHNSNSISLSLNGYLHGKSQITKARIEIVCSYWNDVVQQSMQTHDGECIQYVLIEYVCKLLAFTVIFTWNRKQ